MMRTVLILAALLVLFVASRYTATAGTRVVSSETMTFSACLQSIRDVATQLGVAPINIVETTSLRIVRFLTNDDSGESVLVTCSKADQKRVINESW